jgi:hypothetical protein
MDLGAGFVSDPQLEWAGEAVLSDETSTFRMERLSREIEEYKAQVLDEETSFPESTYRFVIDTDFDELMAQLKAISREDFLLLLEKAWSSKYKLLSETSLDSLFDNAKTTAASHSVNSKEGTLYFILLMFLCGHEFDKDRQYDWSVAFWSE